MSLSGSGINFRIPLPPAPLLYQLHLPSGLILSCIMADVQAVLSALNAFNQPSDKASFEKANAWLQDFQHSVNILSPLVQRATPADSRRIPERSLGDV